MKRVFISSLLCMTLLSASMPTLAAPTKQQKRVAYTIKNLKLDATTQKSLQPMLVAYLNELKAVQKPYEDMKDKYKNDIDKGTLTDKLANALLAAKWKCAKDETAVKEKYEKQFRTVLTAKKVWYCFSLLNDKMSKIEGTGAKDEE